MAGSNASEHQESAGSIVLSKGCHSIRIPSFPSQLLYIALPGEYPVSDCCFLVAMSMLWQTQLLNHKQYMQPHFWCWGCIWFEEGHLVLHRHRIEVVCCGNAVDRLKQLLKLFAPAGDWNVTKSGCMIHPEGSSKEILQGVLHLEATQTCMMMVKRLHRENASEALT